MAADTFGSWSPLLGAGVFRLVPTVAFRLVPTVVFRLVPTVAFRLVPVMCSGNEVTMPINIEIRRPGVQCCLSSTQKVLCFGEGFCLILVL